MDLLYLYHSLMRKKWLVIFATIAGLVAGAAFVLNIKKTYTALAQYSTGFTMGQKVKIKSEEGLNIFEIDFQFRNVIETFKSPTVLGMVGYNLMLHDLDSNTPFRTLTPEQAAWPQVSAISKARAKQLLQEKLVSMELLRNHIPEEKKVNDLLAIYGYDEGSLMNSILPERAMGTDYLNIWFKSENPELSAFVVNTAGMEFQRFFSRIYSTRTTESASKLDSLVAVKKRELDEKNKKYEKLREELGAPDIGGTSVAAMEVVKEATTRYTDESAKLNNLRSSLRSVEDQLNALGSSPSATNPNANNAEILRLRNENKDLAQQLAQKGGTDAAIQKQMDDNNKRILQLSPSSSGANRSDRIQEQREALLRKKYDLEADIRSAEQNVGLYSSQKRQYDGLARSGGGNQVIANAYESDIKILTNEYEYLKNRLQTASDLSVAPDINFKQTLLGQPPSRPDPTKRTLIVGASGIAMFVLSAALVVLLALLDGSLKTPSVFLRNTRLRLLSTLNKVDLKKKDVGNYFDPAASLKSKESIFLENMRKLRYEIEASGKKTFLFTSNKPKEGKTTVMEALASGLSRSKKKVLLIDSNFSNNTLTRKYEAKPALAEFSINGEKNPLEKFWNITSVTNIPNVDLVGCQGGNYSPSEVLPKNNLLENLPALSNHYDYIFIEGAALNNHADSKELSKYVDGIVSVFSSKSVLRQTDKESIHFLRKTGDKYVGAVLNGVEAENLDL